MKQPSITPIKESGSERYRNDEPYAVDLRPYGHTKRFVIPDGFLFDGASVPRWLQSLSGLSPDGLHRAAAMVHDYLYVVRGFEHNPFHKVKLSRKEVDQIFRDMLKALKIADHRIFLAYWAVRIGGRFYWDD